MIKEAIAKLLERNDLSREEMQMVMEEIMRGEVASEQMATFLTSLRMKGETIEEITGACLAMRKFATKIRVQKEYVLDTCGTGGDNLQTFNISTLSALVASGAGVIVAKHGNRSVSSRCGSADLLEAMGVRIDVEPLKVEECINRIGIGFLFAPKLHPAMKYATPVRRQMGIRTIFNILGPLANPAEANYQLLGVYSESLVEPLAYCLANLGLKGALVVHGLDNLDEITTTTQTAISELKDGKINSYRISPQDFGIEEARLDELKGGDISLNLKIAEDVLSGGKGRARDVVLLNAGCAIYVAEQATDIKEGIALAAQSIDEGRAKQKLKLLIEYTNK